LLTVCPPETRVITLGTVNDVSLYRSLLDVGAADYLLMPVQPDILQQSLDNLARAASVSETETKSMRTIGIVGVRGGVGASTIAVNIAWHAANEMGRRVALLDLDIQFGTVTLALDLEPCHGMREILENPERADSLFISSAMARESENLMVLGAEESLDSELSIDPAAVGTLLDGLDPTLEFVFIDLPRSFMVAHPSVLSNLDSVVLVVDPSLAAIRDTTRLAELIRSAAPDIQIVITANKVGANKKGELPVAELKRNIQMPVQHTIPWDAKIPAEAANSGKSLAAVGKRSPIVDAINRLSEGVTAAAQTDTRARGIGRWMRKS
jgi:pilus assembly protein CpaE